MRSKAVALIVIVALGIALYFGITGREASHSNSTQDSESKSTPTAEEVTPSANQNPTSAAANKQAEDDPRVTRLPDKRVLYNSSLESSRQLDESDSPQYDLQIVSRLLEHYRYVYKENPVGVENFEIVEQLNGKNPKQIVFIDPSLEKLQNNQLLDAWGTPYFFHALSAQHMTIHSAGPDKKLWTDDDLSYEAQ